MADSSLRITNIVAAPPHEPHELPASLARRLRERAGRTHGLPDIGILPPDLGLHRPDLGLHRPDLGFHRPDLRGHRTELLPPPGSDLLIGIDLIGHGYDGGGRYAREVSVRMTPLIDLGAELSSCTVGGQSYVLPSTVAFRETMATNLDSFCGKAIDAYSNELSIKVNMKGAYGLFSGEVRSSYSSTLEKYWEYYYSTVHLLIHRYRLALTQDVTKLRTMLTSEARQMIDSASPEQLFQVYGTHYLREAIMGGCVAVAITTEISKYKDTTEIGVAANMAVGSFFSVDVAVANKDTVSHFNEASSCTIETIGGGLGYLEDVKAGHLHDWEISIAGREQLVAIDRDCLGWISNLAGTPARQQELRSAADAYLKVNAVSLSAEPESPYMVSVQTGDREDAGTDAHVYLTLYGAGGLRTEETTLAPGGDAFERGRKDAVLLKLRNVGDIQKLRIRHDNSGDDPGWYLSEVTVQHERTGQNWTFRCEKWLATDEGDGKIDRFLYPKTTDYRITVKTGDVKDAGTDARVFITLIGEDGALTEEEYLDNDNDNFERGQTDVFHVLTRDVGALSKIRLRHDDSGSDAGWFVSCIEIECPASGQRWVAQVNRWLAKDEGDRRVDIEVPCARA